MLAYFKTAFSPRFLKRRICLLVKRGLLSDLSVLTLSAGGFSYLSRTILICNLLLRRKVVRLLRGEIKYFLLLIFLLTVGLFLETDVKAMMTPETCKSYQKAGDEFGYRYCLIISNRGEAVFLGNKGQETGDEEKARQAIKTIAEEIIPFTEESRSSAKTAEEKTKLKEEEMILHADLAHYYSVFKDFEKAFDFADLAIEKAPTKKEKEMQADRAWSIAMQAKNCERYDKYYQMLAEMKKEKGEEILPWTGARRKVCGGQPEGKEKRVKISGKIIDWLQEPVAYISLTIDSGEEKKSIFTGKDGNFTVELKGDLEKKWKARLEFLAAYKGGMLFSMIDKRRGGDDPIWIEIKFNPKKNPFNIELDFSKEALKEQGLIYEDLSSNVPEAVSESRAYKVSANLGLNYTGFIDAFLFAFEKLKINKDALLARGPLKVLLFNEPGEREGKGTYFALQNNMPTVVFDTNNINFFNSYTKYVPYHEFSHFVMEMIYPGIPPDPDPQKRSKNHQGFLNPNTNDSFIEGFATFLPLLINEFMGEKEPEIYGAFGSMEVNWRPWDGNGLREEFAVASLLWDLYDGVDRADSDEVQIPWEKLWELLSWRLSVFADVYENLGGLSEETQKKVDALFVEHGFFRDVTKGDGERDPFEPYKDTNKNGRYDEGEEFFDLAGDYGIPVFDEGEIIGPAAHYQRKERRDTPRLDRMVVSVPKDGVYIVKVDFKKPHKNQSYKVKTYAENGVAYVELPPRRYKGKITVRAEERPRDRAEFTIEKGYENWNSGAKVLATVEEKPIISLRLVVTVLFASLIIASAVFVILRKKRQGQFSETEEVEDVLKKKGS